MNKTTKARLAALPQQKLFDALAYWGQPQPVSKAAAIAEVIALHDAGRVAGVWAGDLDALVQAIMQAPAAAPQGAASSDQPTRAEIATLRSDVYTTFTKSVEELREDIARVRGQYADAQTAVDDAAAALGSDLLNTRAALERSITRLEAEVQAARKAAQSAGAPEPGALDAIITQRVGESFAAFRSTATPEQVREVADSLSVYTLRTAGEVFGEEACYYETAGERVDFGALPVRVFENVQEVGEYIFNPENLHQSLIAIESSLPHNVWLGGERGTGKSEFVSQLAGRLGRRLFRVNFDEALERADYIGANSIEGGDVVWKPGILAQAISTPGAVVLLDEIGFARAQSLAPLHALLERSPHRALTIAETGQRLPVAEGVVFFCADNSTGHGDASGNFAGVREQNSAFLDRFSFSLCFEYLPREKEIALLVSRTGITQACASMIVSCATVARQKASAGVLTQPPSLRQLFAWADAARQGVPVWQAYQSAIVRKFPAECEAELVGVFTSQINIPEFTQWLAE